MARIYFKLTIGVYGLNRIIPECDNEVNDNEVTRHFVNIFSSNSLGKAEKINKAWYLILGRWEI